MITLPTSLLLESICLLSSFTSVSHLDGRKNTKELLQVGVPSKESVEDQRDREIKANIRSGTRFHALITGKVVGERQRKFTPV